MATDNRAFVDVGKYLVQSYPIIGRGSFGIVYAARHKITNERVVAKDINLGDGEEENSEARDRAFKELDILSSLQSHRGIVKLLSYVVKDNSLFLFMELCDKGDLGTYLKNNPNLNVRNRIIIMEEMVSAIHYMHSQKPPIVHRDLKPENILLKHTGSMDIVKVTDFGLSKIYEGSENLASMFIPGKFMMTTCGSQYFMAPEFFAELDGGTQYDETVDIFSLGLIMKVLTDYSPTRKDLYPLSVSSRKAKKDVCYGAELIDKFKSKEPLPKLFEEQDNVDKHTRRLHRIISKMAVLLPRKRKTLDDIQEELSEMLDDMTEEKSSSAASSMETHHGADAEIDSLSEQMQKGMCGAMNARVYQEARPLSARELEEQEYGVRPKQILQLQYEHGKRTKKIEALQLTQQPNLTAMNPDLAVNPVNIAWQALTKCNCIAVSGGKGTTNQRTLCSRNHELILQQGFDSGTHLFLIKGKMSKDFTAHIGVVTKDMLADQLKWTIPFQLLLPRFSPLPRVLDPRLLRPLLLPPPRRLRPDLDPDDPNDVVYMKLYLDGPRRIEYRSTFSEKFTAFSGDLPVGQLFPTVQMSGKFTEVNIEYVRTLNDIDRK